MHLAALAVDSMLCPDVQAPHLPAAHQGARKLQGEVGAALLEAFIIQAGLKVPNLVGRMTCIIGTSCLGVISWTSRQAAKGAKKAAILRS